MAPGPKFCRLMPLIKGAIKIEDNVRKMQNAMDLIMYKPIWGTKIPITGLSKQNTKINITDEFHAVSGFDKKRNIMRDNIIKINIVRAWFIGLMIKSVIDIFDL